MNNNNKTFLQKLKIQAALLLFVLLGVQNIKACYGFEPVSCIVFHMSYKCGEDPTLLEQSYSTGASIRYVCYRGAGYQSCNDYGTTINCTYTVHDIFCDGSSTDDPASFTAPEATYDPTPCS